MKMHFQADMNITEEEQKILDQLLSEVIEQHSFNYTTLKKAKKTINIGSINYCFDALSLCTYNCNLKPLYKREFNKMLFKYYETHYNREEQKEQKERVSLFYYLTDSSCPYTNFTIKKETRPDFVLEGDRKVGVEVVELTTETDQIYYSILLDNLGKGKTIEQIEEAAKKKHGRKAEIYDYSDVSGSPSVGITRFNICEARDRFAVLLYNKYIKYKDELANYDEFVVLGDARRVGNLAIVDYSDIEDITESLKIDSEMKNITYAILWQENASDYFQLSQIKF